MERKLKAYMLYNRHSYTEDGAALAFAHTAREAKKVAWRSTPLDEICGGEYIDVACNLIKGEGFIFEEADQEKLKAGIAHGVNNPWMCEQCELWGKEKANKKLCVECNHDNIRQHIGR